MCYDIEIINLHSKILEVYMTSLANRREAEWILSRINFAINRDRNTCMFRAYEVPEEWREILTNAGVQLTENNDMPTTRYELKWPKEWTSIKMDYDTEDIMISKN